MSWVPKSVAVLISILQECILWIKNGSHRGLLTQIKYLHTSVEVWWWFKRKLIQGSDVKPTDIINGLGLQNLSPQFPLWCETEWVQKNTHQRPSSRLFKDTVQSLCLLETEFLNTLHGITKNLNCLILMMVGNSTRGEKKFFMNFLFIREPNNGGQKYGAFCKIGVKILLSICQQGV